MHGLLPIPARRLLPQERGLYSILWLAQVLSELNTNSAISITVLTESAQPVTDETLNVDYAPLIGGSKVIGQEYLGLRCRSIDICAVAQEDEEEFLELLARELMTDTAEPNVAYRTAAGWSSASSLRPSWVQKGLCQRDCGSRAFISLPEVWAELD